MRRGGVLRGRLLLLLSAFALFATLPGWVARPFISFPAAPGQASPGGYHRPAPPEPGP